MISCVVAEFFLSDLIFPPICLDSTLKYLYVCSVFSLVAYLLPSSFTCMCVHVVSYHMLNECLWLTEVYVGVCLLIVN